ALDGEISPPVDMEKINPNAIESIAVLKDESAVAKYGEKAKHGVAELTSKTPQAVKHDSIKICSAWVDGKKVDIESDGALVNNSKGNTRVIEIQKPVESKNRKQALIVVDGKEMPTDYSVNTVDRNSIESVTVLKDEAGTSLYGEKAKDG